MSYHAEYADNSLDIENLVTISEVNKHFSPKFNTHVHDYAIRFNVDLLPPLDDLIDVFQILYQTFVYLFERLLRDFSAADHVRIVILSDSLDTPIVIPYLPMNKISVDMVFDAIADVLNSQDQFDITEGFKIHITRTVLPEGAGRYARSSEIAFQTWVKRKRNTIIYIPNTDNLCLARAIVVAIEEQEHTQESKPHFNRFVQNTSATSKQTRAALLLHTLSSVATNKLSCDFTDITSFQKSCQYGIHVYDKFLSCVYNCVEEESLKGHIYLLLYDCHYSVIRSMKSFTGSRQFCDHCQKGFNSHVHKCKSTSCRMCNNIKCTNANNVFSSGEIQCHRCGKSYYSSSCLGAHVSVKSERCEKCDKLYPSSQRRLHTQACGKFRCSVCNTYFELPREDHFCYVQRLVDSDHSDDSEDKSDTSDNDSTMSQKANDMVFWFDFETMFVDEGYHVPNLLVCVNEQETWIFKGENLMTDFFNMVSQFMKQTRARLIFLSHNGSGFDNMLILRGAYDQGLKPKIFYRGSKILMLELFKRVRFLCSYLFLPFSLRQLAKDFGMKLQKLYFPYLLNRREFINEEIDFPDEEFFNPNSLRAGDYDQFKIAYDAMKTEYAQSGKRYNVWQELEKYCMADTLVLRDVCLRFTKEFESMTKLKPFSMGITLPSVCLTLYRRQHLPSSNMLPVFPTEGIATRTQYSKICCVWLQWKSLKEGILIQGAHNTGEVPIGPYRVDGFYRNPVTNHCTIYEFYGCAYHSCGEHFPDPNGMNQIAKVTHAQMRTKNRIKLAFLRNTAYCIVEMWECEFVKDVEHNPDIQLLAKQLGIAQLTRLHPRDALYGGRVEAFNMYAEKSTSETIDYYDFVSLYPTVMCGNYSIGKPKILYGFMLGSVESIDFFALRGLLYVKILPPRGVLIPVLPFRTKDYGLTFALCATCATSGQRNTCKHTDEERAMVGVWSHIEIHVALEENYRIMQVYEIYHFEEYSNMVFKSYIDTFMAAKISNSGFPPNINSDLEKLDYLEQLYSATGIRFALTDITKNTARKAVAKLCLNSLWGKFSQNTRQKTTKVLSEPAEFFKLHTDPAIEIEDFFSINDDLLHVTYSDLEDTRTRGTRCLIVAIETTAMARIKLFKLLKSLGHHRLIYTDTDFVVFRSKIGDFKPETGNFFGQLQDEIASKFGGGYINRFVSLGCKTYAMEIIGEMGERRYETRCKGISLNMRTMKNINFDSMLRLLKTDIRGVLIMEEPYFIQRVKKEAKLSSVFRRKILQFTFKKRIVDFDTFETVPLGYC